MGIIQEMNVHHKSSSDMLKVSYHDTQKADSLNKKGGKEGLKWQAEQHADTALMW
jgi:hypothetical protein